MMRVNLTGYTEQEILNYVLDGLIRRRAELEEKIRALGGLTKPRKPANGVGKHISAPKAQVNRKPLSRAARERIAAAQRKRWAATKRAKHTKEKVRIRLVG